MFGKSKTFKEYGILLSDGTVKPCGESLFIAKMALRWAQTGPMEGFVASAPDKDPGASIVIRKITLKHGRWFKLNDR